MLFKNRAQVFKQLKIKGKERVNLLKLVTVVENIEEDTEILDIRILGKRLKTGGVLRNRNSGKQAFGFAHELFTGMI